MSIVLDSHTEDNQDTNYIINTVHPSTGTAFSAIGQSFVTPASPDYLLYSAIFYLARTNYPTGNLQAQLFLHSGTYGTSSVPTGNPIAVSSLYDSSLLGTGYALIEFLFTGINQIALLPSTNYCIAVVGVSSVLNSGNNVKVGRDTSSPAHAGNSFYFRNSAWSALATTDVIFYLNGILPAVGAGAGSAVQFLLSLLVQPLSLKRPIINRRVL